MYRRLVLNTLISAGSLFITSLVALALVPVLLQHYGLTNYGLITLARLFLPAGYFALFDFGYSETATQVTARARDNSDWFAASRQFSGLLVVSAVVATLVAIPLFVLSGWLTLVFRAPPDQIATFTAVMKATAVSFVPLLMGSVVDGIVKGFEDYRAIRLAEIVSAITYAGIALLSIYAGKGFAWVAVGYLVSLLIRLAILTAMAFSYLPGAALAARLPNRHEWADLRHRCRVMAVNKLLGVSQTQLGPFLIGAFLGPAAAGIYDIVQRFPRFLRTVLSVVNAAVLPVAARLEAAGQSMRRLGEVGALATSIASMPLSACGIALSKPLLTLWVGDFYVHYWIWQAIMFIPAITNTIMSFGGTALLVRPHVVKKFNQIAVVQMILQFGISFAFVSLLKERAFILGYVVAVIPGFLARMWIQSAEKDVRAQAYMRPLGVLGLSGALAAFCFVLRVPELIHTKWQLIGVGSVFLATNFALIWYLVLTASDRSLALGFASKMRPNAAKESTLS